MEINRLNYELYFVDFYEGNLTKDQETELYSFLTHHADLKAEFEEYQELPSVEFEDLPQEFSELKIKVTPVGEIDEHNADKFLVANIDNQLSASEQTNLEQFLRENEVFVEEQKGYEQTILHANTDVQYKNKEQLKRTIPFYQTNMFRAVSGVAALLILSFLSFVKGDVQEQYNPRNGFVAQTIDIPHFEPYTERTFKTTQAKKIPTLKTSNSTAKMPVEESRTLVNQSKPIHTTAPQESVNERDFIQDDEPLLAAVEPSYSIQKYSNPNITDESPNVKQERSSLAKWVRKKVFNKNVKTDQPLNQFEKAATLIAGINKVLKTKLRVVPAYNHEGDMVAYNIESPTVQVEKRIK